MLLLYVLNICFKHIFFLHIVFLRLHFKYNITIPKKIAGFDLYFDRGVGVGKMTVLKVREKSEMHRDLPFGYGGKCINSAPSGAQ